MMDQSQDDDDDTRSIVSNATARTTATAATATRRVFVDAALHSYLGEQQDAPTQFTNQELLPYHTYDMLLYPVPDIVVFPGATLPIRLQNREFIRRLQAMLATVTASASSNTVTDATDMREGRGQGQNRLISTHIGIIQVMVNSRTNRIQTATHGTTIALSSTCNGTTLDDEEVIFKSKAKHRFQIVKMKSSRIVIEATVMILPDTPLSPNLMKFRVQDHMPHWIYDMHSPRRLARILYQRWKSSLDLEGKETIPLVQNWGPIDQLSPVENANSPSPSSSSRNSNKKRRGDEDLHNIKDTIYHVDNAHRPYLYHAERDPVAFSYYVASNLVLSGPELQDLLEANDVITRLKMLLQILSDNESKRMIACAVCGQNLSPKSELFNVPGAEGIAGAYVNRHGVIHQTMTLRTLNNNAFVFLHGGPSTEDSWFPGYAWTIAYCLRCHNHLGWKFTIANGSETEHAVIDDDDEDNSDDMFDDDSTGTWETEEDSDQESSSDGNESDGEDEESMEVRELDVENHGNDTNEVRSPLVDNDESNIEALRQSSSNESDSSEDTFHTSQQEPMEISSPSPVTPAALGQETNSEEIPVVREFWGLRRAAIKEQ